MKSQHSATSPLYLGTCFLLLAAGVGYGHIAVYQEEPAFLFALAGFGLLLAGFWPPGGYPAIMAILAAILGAIGAPLARAYC